MGLCAKTRKRGARSQKERGRVPEREGQVRRAPKGEGKRKYAAEGPHLKMERRIGAPIAAPRPRLPCRSYLHRRGRPLQELGAPLLYWRRRRCPKTSRRCGKCPCGSCPARTATRATGGACLLICTARLRAMHDARTTTGPPPFGTKTKKPPSFGEMGSLPAPGTAWYSTGLPTRHFVQSTK